MDQNLKNFPVLSYVMARFNSKSRSQFDSFDDTSDIDLENPSIRDPPCRSPFSLELVERMPHLTDPEVLASMKIAVAEVAKTRFVLQTLGERPDHESVDVARARTAEIDQMLTRSLEDILRASPPAHVEIEIWQQALTEKEKLCRTKAEREKVPYKAVIQLDEMHEAYEKLLKDAEEKLVRIYERHGLGKEEHHKEEDGREDVNEEVIRILQEALKKSVERVELSGRQLRFLPEAFGRMKGLVSLDISNNQLEVLLI